MIDLSAFHFLRPFWLLAIPLVALVWWRVRTMTVSKPPSDSMIAGHLRDALTINRPNRARIRAVDGVSLVLLFFTLSAAGPAWNQQPSPWFAETAPLVVAIEVSDSMRANDLQPTRLDRARFKVLDLVSQRTGARTAIIAYAGSAHIVMPPTKDVEVIKPFLEGLDPAVMPKPGANASTVLPLAMELLNDQSTLGSLLFVNDGFDSADIAPLADFTGQPNAPELIALVFGTEEGGVALMPDGSPVAAAGGGRLDTRLDTATLGRASSEAGVTVIRSAAGDSDVNRVLRAVESRLQQQGDPDARWCDQAWWLLWPALVLTLIWFRKGWTMHWSRA